jgi:hypothetical protein
MSQKEGAVGSSSSDLSEVAMSFLYGMDKIWKNDGHIRVFIFETTTLAALTELCAAGYVHETMGTIGVLGRYYDFSLTDLGHAVRKLAP